MITTKTMFDLHDVELNLKIKDIDDRLQLIIPLRRKLLIWFKYNSTKIINKPFDKDLYINNKMKEIEEIYNPIQKYYNIQLFNFTSFNIEIKKLQLHKSKLEELKISEKLFTEILIKFNTKLVDAIIEEDYKFTNNHFGIIGKHLNKNNRLIVDWSTSNKNKEQLKKEGKLPAYKKDQITAEEEGREYKGVNWLSYLSPYNFYFQWKFEYQHYIKFCNIKSYSFIPYRGEKSSSMKIHRYRNRFTEEQLINQYNNLKDAN